MVKKGLTALCGQTLFFGVEEGKGVVIKDKS